MGDERICNVSGYPIECYALAKIAELHRKIAELVAAEECGRDQETCVMAAWTADKRRAEIAERALELSLNCSGELADEAGGPLVALAIVHQAVESLAYAVAACEYDAEHGEGGDANVSQSRDGAADA